MNNPTVIALGITAFGKREFGTTLVYSQSIGLTIWALIDLGRHWLITDPKKQPQRLIWIVPVSVMVGYLIGTMLAAALLGQGMMREWAAQPRSTRGEVFRLIQKTAGENGRKAFQNQ